MLSYSRCLLGLCVVVFVFIRAESSTEEMNLAALIRGVSSETSRREQQTKDFQSQHKNDRDAAVGPKLTTKDGPIQGVMVDKSYIFYGIPFADPPVGAYRWKPPRRVTPWRGVYDATYPRAACVQACVGPLSEECPKKVSGPVDTTVHVHMK